MRRLVWTSIRWTAAACLVVLAALAGCEDARVVAQQIQRIGVAAPTSSTSPDAAVLPRDAGTRRAGGPPRVMYVDGAGSVVKVASEEDVPPEYRSTMIGLAGSLEGRSGYTILTPVPVKPAPTASATRRADPAPAARTSGSPVIVYSTAWCGACKLAKAYLAEKRIAFEDRDIEKDATAGREFAGYGGRGVPLLIVNGKPMHGFNAAALDRELGR